jgi:hypothetical protein
MNITHEIFESKIIKMYNRIPFLLFHTRYEDLKEGSYLSNNKVGRKI